MEFEFTDSIWVEEEELKEMLRLVNEEGYNYDAAFHEVTMGWDDDIYYNAELIENSVIEELKKRNG